MEFKKSLIGMTYKTEKAGKNNYYVVTGYDIVNKQYISLKLRYNMLGIKDIRYVSDEEAQKLLTIEELEVQEKKLTPAGVLVYRKVYSEKKSFGIHTACVEIDNMFRRLYETNKQILAIEKVPVDNRTVTQRVQHKQLKKGLCRAGKRMFRYFSGNDLKILQDYMKKEEYPNVLWESKQSELRKEGFDNIIGYYKAWQKEREDRP